MIETLTPRARPPKPVPKWALVGLVLSILLEKSSGLPGPLLAVIVGITSVVLVVWLEERIWVALSPLPPFFHLLVSLVMLPAGLVALGGSTFMTLAIFGGTPAKAGLALAVVWFASAACGTAMVQFVDLFGRMFASRFATRLLLTVFGLIATAVLATATIVIVVPRGVSALMARAPPDFKITIRNDMEPMSPAELMELLRKEGMLEIYPELQADQLIGWAMVLLAFLLLIPALISASGKLGELAMERVHPLDVALSRVGKGDLQIRVEEAGSIEFVRLAAQFNRMVGSLDLAQRMERAFGAYVSRPVIDRIRAQHGAIALPSMQKEATVFFVDVRGFTAMSEKLTPDRVLDVLNRYYGFALPIVEQYEGYLDKFIGDALYVIFNGPVDQPDHVERATRCAIALQEKILVLNASGAFPEVGRLEVGIGVATGPVVAGNVGTERSTQFSVIGDTVNLASRLCQLAPPGEVWINARSAEALPRDLRSRPLEPIVVKGKERPVHVHRAFPFDPSTPEARWARLPEEHRAPCRRFLDAISACEERGLLSEEAGQIVGEHLLRLGERGFPASNTGNLEDLFLYTLEETRDPVRAFAQVLADSMKCVPPPNQELLPPMKRMADGARLSRTDDISLDPAARTIVCHTALAYADREMRDAALSLLRACSPAATTEELERAFHRMVLQSQHLPSSAYVMAQAHGLALDIREVAARAGIEEAAVTGIQSFFDVASEFRAEWLTAFRVGAVPIALEYLDWKSRYHQARTALPPELLHQLSADTVTNFGAGTIASGKWIHAMLGAGEVRSPEEVPAALVKVVRGYQIEWCELHQQAIEDFNTAAAPHLRSLGIQFDEHGIAVLSA